MHTFYIWSSIRYERTAMVPMKRPLASKCKEPHSSPPSSGSNLSYNRLPACSRRTLSTGKSYTCIVYICFPMPTVHDQFDTITWTEACLTILESIQCSTDTPIVPEQHLAFSTKQQQRRTVQYRLPFPRYFLAISYYLV